MTAKQKDIIRKLLNGHSIVGNSAYGFRLLDQNKNVTVKLSYKTFFRIKGLLRKHKDYFLVNKNKVRQLHGRSFAKQLYKKQWKKSAACEPCSFQMPSRSIAKAPAKRRTVQTSEDQLQIF